MPAPAIPVATPLTLPFWEGCAAGELRLQHCSACARPFFPPALVCPRCAGRDVAWAPVSGRATLYSYTIQHRAAPGFEGLVPYAVAIVQLAEGPRMMTNVVGVESTPEALVLDMPLEVAFAERFGVVMPFFRPTGEPRGAA
jgi:uncharacterized OB-fold protein